MVPRIVNAWDFIELPKDAVTAAFWSEVTAPAVAVKVAVLAPGATGSEAGTVKADAGLLASDTLTPFETARESVTVQVVVAAAVKVVLPHCSEEIEIGARIVNAWD
jgi:hypothetical protein